MKPDAQSKKPAALKPISYHPRDYVKGNHLHCNAIPHVFLGNVGIRFFHFFSSNCIVARRMSHCVCSSAVHACIVRTTAKALPESSRANEGSAVSHMCSFICPLARSTQRRLQTADKAILKHHGNRRCESLANPKAYPRTLFSLPRLLMDANV